MYWYKVKTLLIWMFAAINIFLIAFIVQGKVRQNLYEKQEIETLITVMQRNNISVAEGIASKKNIKVKTASIENLIPSSEETAKIMLGEKFETVTDENGAVKYKSGTKTVSVENGILYFIDEGVTSDKTLSDDKIWIIEIIIIQKSNKLPFVNIERKVV